MTGCLAPGFLIKLKKHDIKRCSKCKIVQTRQNFVKVQDATDYLSCHCRTCTHQYNVANKQYRAECDKIYRLIHLDEIAEQHKNYYNQLGRYDTYASKLKPYGEKVRQDPNNQELIQVQCKLCKEWFNPTNRKIQTRIRAINGNANSLGTENHLYCSQECKDSCPLYRTRISELITQQRLQNNNLLEEDFQRIQQESRAYFLKIKNPDKCELCGKKLDQSDLIMHHIIPVSIEYIFEADIDNVIFICKNCHGQTHQIDGCKTGQLKSFSIENKLC
jgi:hypothetical protein